MKPGELVEPVDRLWSRGMVAVLLAQFLSAFADNAILVGALKLLATLTQKPGQDALLQESFVWPYIVLAPFVGILADALPKGRVMWLANLVKLASALALLLISQQAGIATLWVFAAYLVTGIGAALYSPAKYGILTQLCSPRVLVQANGLMEGSTIVAILLGFVMGGWLADYSLLLLLSVIAGCYALATVLSLFIPSLPPEHPLESFRPWQWVLDFFQALAVLFREPWARISLLGTSVFWGAGSTLRLLLFAWVPFALNIKDTSAATNLGGVVSVGIIIGAALAAMTVRLETVGRSLLGGLLIALPLLLLEFASNLWLAGGLMVVLGLGAGYFVVPLNATLQERGHRTVGAGHAIAVQNFCENLVIAGFVGLFFLARRALDPNQTALLFGAILMLVMGSLFVLRPKTV